MHRNTFLSLVILLVLLAPFAGGAVAQEETSSTATPTPTAEEPTSTPTDESTNTTEEPTPTTTPTSTSTATSTATPTSSATPTAEPSNGSETEYLIEVGPNTRIVDTTWSDGEVEIIVETDRPMFVSVVDASRNLQQHDAVDIKRLQKRLPEGRSRITFQTEKPDSAAVTFATRGGMVGLSPGDGGGGLFNRAAAWTDVRVAALFALTAAPFAGVGIWQKVSSRRVDVEKVDFEEDD